MYPKNEDERLKRVEQFKSLYLAIYIDRVDRNGGAGYPRNAVEKAPEQVEKVLTRIRKATNKASDFGMVLKEVTATLGLNYSLPELRQYLGIRRLTYT